MLHVKESGIDPWMVVPHGSYLLNCGSSDVEVLRKTRETLVDELRRCEKLGLPIYNFHPGLLFISSPVVIMLYGRTGLLYASFPLRNYLITHAMFCLFPLS